MCDRHVGQGIKEEGKEFWRTETCGLPSAGTPTPRPVPRRYLRLSPAWQRGCTGIRLEVPSHPPCRTSHRSVDPRGGGSLSVSPKLPLVTNKARTAFLLLHRASGIRLLAGTAMPEWFQGFSGYELNGIYPFSFKLDGRTVSFLLNVSFYFSLGLFSHTYSFF